MGQLVNSSSKKFIRRDKSSELLLKYIAAQFSEARHSIGKLNSLSEKDFLNLGSNLGNIYSMAKSISGLSSEIIDSIGGDTLSKAIVQVAEMKSAMNGNCESTSCEYSEAANIFRKIADKLESNFANFKNFAKIIMNLNMIGVSTKIESSRLGNLGADFLSLTENIDKLSKGITEKTNSLCAENKSLFNHISDSVRKIDNITGKQQRQQNLLNSQLDKAVEAISGQLTLKSMLAKNIEKATDLITSHIYSIVNSVQFHDITRQQLEHISEILESGSPADAGEASPEDTMLKLYDIEQLCILQINQLDNSRQEFKSATHNIVRRLEDVRLITKSLMKDLMKFIGIDKNEDSGYLLELQSIIVEFKQSIVDDIRIDKEVRDSIAQMIAIVNSITVFIDDIDEISSEIVLIAWNSLIKAARLGKDGAALSVLSEAIQKLSVRTQNDSMLIAESLKSVELLSNDLKNNDFRLIADNISNLTGILEDLKDLVGAFGSMNDSIKKSVLLLKEKVSYINSEIGKFIRNFKIDSQFDSYTKNVLGMLQNVNNKAAKALPLAQDGFQSNNSLIEAERRYTMESERRIHRQSMTLAASPSAGSTQDGQFTASQGKTAEAAANFGSEVFHESEINQSTSEFGDNVELF